MSLNIPKEITKFLVYSRNAKYLRYEFGKFGIYLENVIPLTDKTGDAFSNSTKIIAYFSDELQIKNALCGLDPRLQAKRIFKSVVRTEERKDLISGFIHNCVRNILNLAKGKTFRIVSDDKELQKKFYEVFVKENEAGKTECKFDYDEYNILFWIKDYHRTRNNTFSYSLSDETKIYTLVTVVEGL